MTGVHFVHILSRILIAPVPPPATLRRTPYNRRRRRASRSRRGSRLCRRRCSILSLVLLAARADAARDADDGGGTTRRSQGADAHYRQLVSRLRELAAGRRRLAGLGRHELHGLPLVVHVGMRSDLLAVQGERLEGHDRVP